MKKRNLFYPALLACGLLLVLMTVPAVSGGLVQDKAQQEKLNQRLNMAVKNNDAPAVRLLIQEGADANSGRQFPPNHKKKAAHSPAPSLLCVALDTPVPSDWYSHMPIWYPADRAAVVQSLVDAGANVHVINAGGESPLLLAVRHRHSQATVRALLRAGADVNTQDRNGWTPLIWATYESEPQTVHLLLTHYADPNRGAKGEYARNALSVASSLEIIKMLQRARPASHTVRSPHR